MQRRTLNHLFIDDCGLTILIRVFLFVFLIHARITKRTILKIEKVISDDYLETSFITLNHPMPKKIKTEKTESFEHSLKKLEDIVQTLENGETPLDETLQKFEEGMKLVQFCHSKLNEAEKKLKILVKDKNGNFTLNEEE